MYSNKEKIAVSRYRSGEKLNFSTGTHEMVTYGYGKLDFNGFFEYPLPYYELNSEHQKLVNELDNKQ